MAYAATAGDFALSVTASRVVALQRALAWLVGASGGIVFIEPSPYELMTLAATIIFFATGLRLRLVFMPLLLLLFLVNIGYSIGAIAFFDKPEVANWIATSWYMAVTVMFFAMVVSEDTAARLDMLRRGLIVGGMIAALAGVAGYFNLVPGGHDLLTLYERARGTFKDPNVLGAFLILPALFALQSVVSDHFAKSFRSSIALGILALALLLAFSRAAWGGLAITSAFMLALMVLSSRSRAQRSRISATALVASIVLVMLVAGLLSFDSIGDMFKQRASLGQSYDAALRGEVRPSAQGARAGLLAPARLSFGASVIAFNGKRQAGVIDKPRDQAMAHGGTRSPDAAGNFRGVAQQADRTFRDHFRSRSIAGIAVAAHGGADLTAVGRECNEQQVVHAVLAP